MVSRFVNEVVLCLQDGIVANPLDADMAAIFGIGFAPFRGGPLRFVDTYGAAKLVSEMERLQSQLGDQYEPAPLLVDYAKSGRKFH